MAFDANIKLVISTDLGLNGVRRWSDMTSRVDFARQQPNDTNECVHF